jgi:dTMP kinase
MQIVAKRKGQAMGIFLTIDGAKGTGKTTLVTALVKRLADASEENVVVTKEPTQRFDLRQEAHLSGSDLALAIARDREAHVRDVIAPALEQGKAVVCERYILSSLVFHCGDGVPADDIWDMNATFPLPDATLVLTASAEVILARRGNRARLTRLEAASDPSDENDNYLFFGNTMRQRGVPVAFLPNETPEDLDRAIEWIMRSIRTGIPS